MDTKPYGDLSRKNIRLAAHTAISGMPTKKFSQKKLIGALARKLVRQVAWNVGTIHCGNRMLNMCERPYRSQNPISTMNWLLDCISSATTLPKHHLSLDHYQINNTFATLIRRNSLVNCFGQRVAPLAQTVRLSWSLSVTAQFGSGI
jgi:hypothetical protein